MQMRKLANYLKNNYSFIYKIFLFVISVFVLGLIFPRQGIFKYEYSKGKPWLHEDLIAPFDFPVYKSDARLKTEQQQALLEVPPCFSYKQDMKDNAMNLLEDEFMNRWDSGNTIDNKEGHFQIAQQILDTILSRGIIERHSVLNTPDVDKILLLTSDNIAHETLLTSLFTLNEAQHFIRASLDNLIEGDDTFLFSLVSNALVQNVIYNEQASMRLRNEALQSVSLTRGMVQKGERIISRGELISEENFQLLESLRKEYESQLGSSGDFFFIRLGQLILLSISMMSLALFLFMFRRDIVNENKKLLLLLLVIILMVLGTGLMVKYNIDYLYLLPVCILPVIVRAFFDVRLALLIHVITIFILGFLVPNSFEFVFLQLMAGIITIISISSLKRRSQFSLTSVMIFFTYSAIYSGMMLIREGGFESIEYINYAFFAGSAFLTLFSQPLIYVFEKIFGYITDVTLIELSDTNNKLLRQLSQKAPGTFQHSLQVANLAEEVIYEIGGNGLLVRAGALYHDIGKMDMPLYFVENQLTGVNPHDDLSPKESAQIIMSHIIKGVEKAKKHKLPEALIDFIRTHHGTRKTGYFYALARQQHDEEGFNEEDYTYHGPVPYSRETAVLMMADSVEAASRSLVRPDEGKIENLVEQIISDQLENSQFDNADITLRDISKAKKILKRKLMNIYHLRIEYPEV